VNLTGCRLRAAEFHGATFIGGARFVGARGLKAAGFEGVRLAPVPAGVERLWPDDWRAEDAGDGWQTLRLAAAGGDTAEDGPGAGPAGKPGG
jgi:hypothetical protein